MKKLVIAALLSCLCGVASADHPYYLDYPHGKARKRWWIGVETSAKVAADFVIATNVVFDYDLAKCFSLGLGGGFVNQWDTFSYWGAPFGQAFVRFKFEDPAARVSAVFFQDVGIGFNFYRLSSNTSWEAFTGAVTNTVWGARFRMRNGDKLTIGGGIYTHWMGDGCMPWRILPGIHVGYSF